MNKKELVIGIFTFMCVFLFINSALAANETISENNIDKAYLCLENQVEGKTLSLKEATFSALAIGAKGEIADRIESERDSNSCWPKGACNVKETAQVALAYNRMGSNTAQIKDWLLSKRGTASELKWLLEIDITNKVPASCTIKDGQRENNIRILDNSKIQGSPGTCLSIDSSGYVLRISPSCLDKEFEISCDQDFISSILYQKSNGGTFFILPETHSAASLGTTKEKVNGECFKSGNVCDYEGSLWAALALQKTGEDISKFTPYLLALADDNERYFPSAFLYILFGGEDQYNQIVQLQKQGKFWEIAGTRDGRYYDTSLALLALANGGGAEVDATKDYLSGIQTNDGCWNSNNIRDTAFLLYAGWPKTVASFGNVNSPPSCEPTFSCENAFECTQAGGTIEFNYACTYAGTSCCSVQLQKASCSQKQGLSCSSGTECSGRVESSADGPCCVEGACIEVQGLNEDTCTPVGGTCKVACGSEETESSDKCLFSGERCCITTSGTNWVFWIVVLLILIALTVLGIIFREKVKLWWFKLREAMTTRFRKKNVASPVSPAIARPNMQFAPATRPMMMPVRRPIMQPGAPVRPIVRDKEMEEAMRRLREMSKK